jgi:hypothetical protein
MPQPARIFKGRMPQRLLKCDPLASGVNQTAGPRDQVSIATPFSLQWEDALFFQTMISPDGVTDGVRRRNQDRFFKIRHL